MADTSAYPGALDGDLRALVAPATTPSGFEDFAQLLADAVAKIETELGTNPSGAAATVAAAIAALAPLASPALTGTPTAPTAAGGTNSTQLATTAFVAAAQAALVDSSPAALDTLNELAAALGDDPNFATTVTNALAAKADTTALDAHEADTTNIHGIADTAALLTEAEAASTYLALQRQAGYASGRYSGAGATAGVTSTAAGKLYLVPVIIPRACSVDRLVCEVTTAGSAGALARLGIATAGDDGMPALWVLDGGTVDAASTGVKSLVVNQALNAGVHFLGVAIQGAPATAPAMRSSGSGSWYQAAQDNQNAVTFNLSGYVSVGTVDGAFIGSVPFLTGQVNTPRVVVRFA